MNLEHCSIQQALPVSTEPPVEKQCVHGRVLVTYLKINKKVVLQTRGSSLCQAICLSQPALRVKDLAENRTVSLRNSMLQCQVCIKPILGLLGNACLVLLQEKLWCQNVLLHMALGTKGLLCRHPANP